jgi:hypothetical protein
LEEVLELTVSDDLLAEPEPEPAVELDPDLLVQLEQAETALLF